MKSKVVKFLVLTLLVCSLLTVAVGCKKDKNNGAEGDRTEQIESSMTIAPTEMSLKVGDTGYIVPTVERVSGVEFEYTSSDATVASVTDEGEVNALKEGNTEIVVKYGDLQANCKVSVSLGGELPVIVVNGIDENSVQNVAKGTTFTINPYITFNGKRYDDATFEYAIEHETVAVEENGGIKALSCGGTVVKITANWRGVKNATLERTFTLKVIPNVEISVNGGLNSIFELYTVANVGNSSFATTAPFNIVAKEMTNDGETDLTPQVEIIEGDSLITISNGTIESKGTAGVAKIKISCKAGNNEEFEQVITVNVLRSVGEYGQTIEFSAADGKLPISTIFGSDENLVSAECEDEVLTISEDKKRVLGLTTLSTGVTEKTITVYGQNVGYKINVNAYTKIITEAKDLEYFLFNNDYSEDITQRFNGYYILGNDIDASGYIRGTNGFVKSGKVNYYANVGLTGTFDGRGHKISNLTLGYVESDFNKFTENQRKEYTYSLFGIIGGGTVKNLAIENLTFNVPSDKVTKGGGISTIATQIIGGTIENVYISMNGLHYGTSNWRPSTGIALRVDAPDNCKPSKIKNCIVEIGDDGSIQKALASSNNNLSAGYGLIFGANPLPTSEKISQICENTYVISPLDFAVYGNITTQATNIDGLKHYRTVAEFIYDTENDYQVFAANDCWNVNNGSVPVWHDITIDASKYAAIGLNGKLGDSFTIENTSGSYELSVKVLGETVQNVTFSVADGNTCVSLSGSTLTVNRPGVAKITAKFTSGSKNIELEATVVIGTTEVYTEVVEFSAMHGTLTQVIGNAEIVYATQGDKVLTISEDKKSILGIQALDEKGKVVSDRAVETEITVYTQQKGYVIKRLKVYAGILTDPKDLNVFNLDNTDYTATATQSGTPAKRIEGYFVLGNDIDASDYAMPTQGFINSAYNTGMANVGFLGTFDGRGYTVKGITFGTVQTLDSATRSYWNNNNYSLFGIIGSGATVKNFAMTDVKFALVNNYTSDTTPMYKATCTALAMWIENSATVENVYISIKGIISCAGFNDNSGSTDTSGVKGNTTLAGLAYGIRSGASASDTNTGAKLNNVVVDFTYSGTDVLALNSSGRMGALVFRMCANSGIPTTWENVYAISGNPITASTDPAHIMYASNDSAADTSKKIDGVYGYSSVDDWEDAQGNDYTSFSSTENSEYWDMTSGVPTWKNL